MVYASCSGTVKQLTGSSPDELVCLLKEIKEPFKVLGITNYGSRQVAYVIFEQEKTVQEVKKQNKTKEK